MFLLIENTELQKELGYHACNRTKALLYPMRSSKLARCKKQMISNYHMHSSCPNIATRLSSKQSAYGTHTQ
jgi:hypothetical protein